MSTPLPVNVRGVSKAVDDQEPWEQHLVLRVPPEVVDRMNKVVTNDSNAETLSISFSEDNRSVQIKVGNQLLPAKLLDLPTITELHKTFDKRNLYKVGDISQIIMCDGAMPPPKEKEAKPSASSTIGEVKNELEDGQTSTAEPKSARQIAKQKAKVHKYPHGLTSVMKNAKKRRFRKKKEKNLMCVEEIETELKKLLRADLEATSIRWEIVDADGNDGCQGEEELVVEEIDDGDDEMSDPEFGDDDEEKDVISSDGDDDKPV